MQNTIKLTFLLVVFALLAFSCKDKKKEEVTNFQKSELLSNLADNLVDPAYVAFSQNMSAFQQDWNSFKNESVPERLIQVQSDWKVLYRDFQWLKIFDLGPASDIGLAGALGTFPSDTALIEANINSGNYDLASVANITATGLPALDYLLFSSYSAQQLNQAGNRQTYISAVIQKMTDEARYVSDNWKTYRNSFVEGTSTSSTSPFSLLVNTFCKDFELAKNAKIGIPIGKQSLGIQRPEYFEARYAQVGKTLLVENVRALQAVFKGMSITGVDGKGFDDYLIALDRGALVNQINEKFDYLISQPAAWNESLEKAALENATDIDNYYLTMQTQVVALKTDMSAAFGILITYQDNDGD